MIFLISNCIDLINFQFFNAFEYLWHFCPWTLHPADITMRQYVETVALDGLWKFKMCLSTVKLKIITFFGTVTTIKVSVLAPGIQ